METLATADAANGDYTHAVSAAQAALQKAQANGLDAAEERIRGEIDAYKKCQTR